ncbi:hypothetical protein YN1HA_17180 [Sulfurisphaera ohwakuensis]
MGILGIISNFPWYFLANDIAINNSKLYVFLKFSSNREMNENSYYFSF